MISALISLLALAGGAAATPKACSITTPSCTNTTAIADTCCFNYPGGHLLTTQFWDTAPVTGPVDSWTIHGLWPDLCDGTYDAFCDSSREYTDITGTLKSAGETDLLAYMQTYWKDYEGDDESFWQHEWNKHGTCISTLETKCYTNYVAREELIDYLHTTVDLFKTRNTYAILAAAGITPSSSTTYAATAVQAALTAYHGYAVTIRCSSGALNEVWYHYHARGSVATGEFLPAAPLGSNTCSGNIKYLPKTSTSTPTTTTTASGSTPTGSIVTGTGTWPGVTGGSTKGCLIGAGTWYSGTCATYTAAASGSGFTLTTSKGKCAVSSAGKFSCASGNTASIFTVVSGKLAYNGVSTWYASAAPSGTTQIDIYTASASGRTTAVTFSWA